MKRNKKYQMNYKNIKMNLVKQIKNMGISTKLKKKKNNMNLENKQ